MAQPEPNASPAMPAPVLIKKYANRRLYDTETSSYVTLETLAGMVRQGRDFVVQDARSGEDLTRAVLTQIIVEEESKGGGAMLPVPFLRQLIGFYGDSLQKVLPDYLEQSMTAFSRQQREMREAVRRTMGTLVPPGFDELGRRNMAMMERAMTLFSPFYPKAEGEDSTGGETVESLREEVERLRGELRAVRQPPPKPGPKPGSR